MLSSRPKRGFHETVQELFRDAPDFSFQAEGVQLFDGGVGKEFRVEVFELGSLAFAQDQVSVRVGGDDHPS